MQMYAKHNFDFFDYRHHEANFCITIEDIGQLKKICKILNILTLIISLLLLLKTIEIDNKKKVT